ncbi:OadG family protein [Bacteroidota bacterium]
MNCINILFFSVQDSLSKVGSGVLREITFDPSNIIKGNGIMISIVGYSIVFVALVLLWFFLAYLSKLLVMNQRRRLKDIGHRAADNPDIHIPGEISAAIAMSLHLHFREAHDFENTVLTIKKIQRTYSPWSSKVYNLTEAPEKN